ncbi:anhydro-N-acetylmuramic acid kinase [Ekhidna sp.]|uniref:anhydro-N-acetylmuramic acid kinase n=1 Tax=Ekhidna sp. TaxID=2608089 RepID=UPI003B5082C4
MKNSTYNVIGVMAGSSMDGLDIALVEFELISGSWKFELKKGVTKPYNDQLIFQLENSSWLSHADKLELDTHFGEWISQQILEVSDFWNADLIAVHGHTVIHEPENGISWQLGRGEIIAKKCNVTTITDYRTEDIRLGGQGAPLVPFGDFVLFDQYDACLNLGGICNVSVRESHLAWDICPCNQVLNFFAKKLGKEYDRDGLLARQGKLDQGFYDHLSSFDFFSKPPPKSLANNYLRDQLLSDINPYDGLFTYTHFIVDQISESLSDKGSRLLVTGGGANNKYLIEILMERLTDWEVEIPSQDIVDFKEAIIFGFLGVKRFRNEVNVLSSATGASKDSSSGVIHLP